MREILFRGKTEKGDWYIGSLCKSTFEKPISTNVVYKIQEFNQGFADEDEFEPTYISGFDEEVIPETIGQYTGLTDKNGKKIFEGDIVKCKHDWQNQGRTMDTDEVAFLQQKIRGAYGKYIDKTLGGFFRWRYHYFRNYAVEYYVLNGGWRVRNGSCFHSLTQTYITNRDLEVIGNIHDNPELLKAVIK